jgi:phosphomethylpyrimidine synthase
MTIGDFLRVIEQQAAEGVDFMTIHSGITRLTLGLMERQGRALNVVSRGGALLVSWLRKNPGRESPLFEHFDDILDILAAYDVTLSLGDGMRPGATCDATDRAQIGELLLLGELTQRAWEKGVQVMIEGPGHMALNEIAANMILEKKLCHGAPFYVLGPLVTDIAPGYDHITSAIGGAIAASSGADFLCYVTPAEHLRLPDLDDVKEGIIASKIAAHAADIANGVKGARDWDNKMSEARVNVDFDTMIKLAIDSEKASRYRKNSTPSHEGTCTMCGKMCPLKNMNKLLKGEDLSLV